MLPDNLLQLLEQAEQVAEVVCLAEQEEMELSEAVAEVAPVQETTTQVTATTQD